MIKLWMIPKNLPLLDVSIEEQKWADNLADQKKKNIFIQEDI